LVAVVGVSVVGLAVVGAFVGPHSSQNRQIPNLPALLVAMVSFLPDEDEEQLRFMWTSMEVPDVNPLSPVIFQQAS
jgi:hypothetical protein